MADDELFEDLEDFGDLEETPDFGLAEEDLSLPEFGGPEEGGVSRTFKIVGAIMALAVLAIVVLLILFAFQGGDKLTANEKTSTAVVKTNVAVEQQYNATLTALALIEQASQTAVHNAELTATAEELIAQTQHAIEATNAAQTATAEFAANQTLAAAQTATQRAVDESLTATAEANRLVGRVIDQQGNIFGGATLKLYRDDGDGVFNPADLTPTPSAPSSSETEGGSAAAQPIRYGEIGQGTLSAGQTVEWVFTGAANDVVTIDAIASDPVQMDMFLELAGAGSGVLTGDDDSGEESNAKIANYKLPADGQYTIRVKTVAGAGDYILMLSLGLAVPSAAPTETPASGGSTYHRPGAGIVLAHAEVPVQQAQGTPLPSGDELMQVIMTATDGKFDFGVLEPGVYWVQLDYATLPPDLQALVPEGTPLVIKVTVPTTGAVTFEIGGPVVPTDTPVPTGLSPIELTGTARALSQTPLPVTTGTPPQIVTITSSPEALPTTGFFSDIGGDAGGLGGTSGLTVLAIAAAGLVAVVFIARKLRTST